jgi:hypothetical protein
MLDLWRAVLPNVFSLKRLAPVATLTGLLVLPMILAADNDSIIFQLSQDDHRIRVEVHGKLTFTEDGRGIASLARGTRVRLEEDDADGVQRRLDIEPAGDGSPAYTWRINGEQHTFDATGRQWLERMLITSRLVPETPTAGHHPH